MAARVQFARGSATSRNILQQLHPRISTASGLYTLAPHRRGTQPDFKVSALAIAIPRRGYATETSTSQGSGDNGPPPGFNINEAKKPLPKEDGQSEAKDASEKSTLQKLKDANEQIHAPGASAPSDVPPTDAVAASSLTELAAQKAKNDERDKQIAKAEGKSKPSLWTRVKHEAKHYWDGYGHPTPLT